MGVIWKEEQQKGEVTVNIDAFEKVKKDKQGFEYLVRKKEFDCFDVVNGASKKNTGTNQGTSDLHHSSTVLN